jgi:hypothetical protein
VGWETKRVDEFGQEKEKRTSGNQHFWLICRSLWIAEEKHILNP